MLCIEDDDGSAWMSFQRKHGLKYASQVNGSETVVQLLPGCYFSCMSLID